MKKENTKEIERKEKALILAERVKLLFGFCADLIPDKEMLKEVLDKAGNTESMTMTLAPILGAFGQDYEVAHTEAKIRTERAKALYDLVDTLDRTEKERAEFSQKQIRKQEGLAQLHRALGL